MTTPVTTREHGLSTQTHAGVHKTQERACDTCGDVFAMTILMDSDEEVGVLGWGQDKARLRRWACLWLILISVCSTGVENENKPAHETAENKGYTFRVKMRTPDWCKDAQKQDLASKNNGWRFGDMCLRRAARHRAWWMANHHNSGGQHKVEILRSGMWTPTIEQESGSESGYK